MSAQAQPAAPAFTPLPTLGDGSDISSGTERRLGDRIARELYRDPDYLDDPVLADYVQGIWQPLLAAARLRGDLTSELEERFAWEIMLIRARSVNAFALPGGYLGVHLGLIAVVGSRAELASVIATVELFIEDYEKLVTREPRSTAAPIPAVERTFVSDARS